VGEERKKKKKKDRPNCMPKGKKEAEKS
jgi:hypothetical protein